MFSFGFNVKSRKAGGVSYDADAQTFFTAASITDTTQKSAVNQLVLDLKSYGVWTKCSAIYPIVGGSASSHAVNLKTPGTFNLTFATGMTHSSTGMVSNGSTGYANTNIIPSVNLSQNNTHVSYYSRTNVNLTQVEIGATTSGAAPLSILEIRTSGISYLNLSANAYITYTDANSQGFYIGSRTASNAIKLYKNNSNVASGTTASTGQANTALSLCAQNNGASRVNYSTKQCAFASIGNGLTDTEAANFYTAVQAYQTTLSRQL